MNVYVLIKTEMEDFDFHTIVCGVYTKEGKEQFEKTIPEKGKELKKRLRLAYEKDIKNFQIFSFSLNFFKPIVSIDIQLLLLR